MLLENFVISSVIFARQAIFGTLYIGKSSGKQDHDDHKLVSGLDDTVMSVGRSSSSRAHL